MQYSKIKFSAIFAALLPLAAIIPHSPAYSQSYNAGWESCKEELSSSFESSYKAGKLTATALNAGYGKLGAAEKKSWRKTLLSTKKGMTQAGVAIITTTKPALSDRVSCYMGAFEKLNTGFITGFGENLTPDLKSIYATVPMF
jgi:hypothetical protein